MHIAPTIQSNTALAFHSVGGNNTKKNVSSECVLIHQLMIGRYRQTLPVDVATNSTNNGLII